jgi:molybdate transport system ATP-binding protein
MSADAMATLELDVALDYPGFGLRFAAALPLVGITGLFGPSGCGKSTLLRIIAGLERNARGRVAFDGEAWQEGAGGRFVPPHRRGVGYVFQETRLFPHLTVAGNLGYADRRSRHAGNAIRMTDVIEALDLQPLLERRTTGLSGGERQRVAIARTLLSRPRLLLMDEPLAALDYRRKGEILPYIERLPSTFGLPMVYVTHAIDEVSRLAERLILMAAGAKTAVGPTADLLNRLDLQPATGRFEAGSMVTAQVIEHDPAFRLTRLEFEGQNLLMPAADLAPGERVQLRIRARDVALATTRPTGISIRNIFEGTIAEIVLEPDTAFAETLVAIGGARLRARITRAAVAELGLAPGSPVFALVKSVNFDRRALTATPPAG